MAENMRNPDEHFKPQVQQCDFRAGAFPPHSILRVENISEWYGRAVHALGLRDDTLDGWPTSDGCFYKCPGASCSDMLAAIDSCAASSQACGPNPRCAAAAAGALLDKTGRLSQTAAEALSIAPATLRRLQTYYAEDFRAFLSVQANFAEVQFLLLLAGRIPLEACRRPRGRAAQAMRASEDTARRSG
jgi:hypothetical protein